MELHGLTPKQLALANIIWEMQSQEDLDFWFETLHPVDRQIGITLLKLMLFEQIDQEINEIDQFPQVESYLKTL
jgi:hypothetical protein